MASNITNSSSLGPDISKCLFDKSVYDIYCLIPSLIIITIFAFLNKRTRIKPEVCGGRPGLVLPINFLGDSTRNRLSIAVAFGVIAGNCLDLFSDIAGLDLSTFSVVKLHGNGPWEKALNTIILVLLYGVVNFPIFASLMTRNLLVGAVFGFLYTLMKFVALMTLLLSCPSPYSQDVQEGALSRAYRESELYERIPGLLCHLFLLVRFSLILIRELLRRPSVTQNEDSGTDIAKEHDFIHVSKLLNQRSSRQRLDTSQNWWIKLRDKLYKPRADFKFSTGMISTLVVVVIFIYYLTVYLVLNTAQLTESVNNARKGMKDPTTDRESASYIVAKYFLELSDIVIASLYVCVFFTSIFSVLMMLHFMKCHRTHVLMSFKTRDFFGNSPSRLVGRSLSYPGYQIAYVGWGYIIMGGSVFILSFILGFFFKYVEWDGFLKYIWSIMPVFVVPICVWLFQFLLGWFVFRDRRFPDITINISNHRLYCIMSFFFLFFNVLVGFFSSIFRILKSMFFGVVFFSRIDRTPLMVGYHSWDQGYMSYIGFLNVLKSFSHPAMLVFCQILLDLCRTSQNLNVIENEVFVGDTMRQPVIDCDSEAKERRTSHPVSKTAFNRWLVAYTLIKNPDLQRLRKRN